MDELVILFENLQIGQDSTPDQLDSLVDQMKNLSLDPFNNNEIDELRDELEKIEIVDDTVIMTSKHGNKLHIFVQSCRIDYMRANPWSQLSYGEAY